MKMRFAEQHLNVNVPMCGVESRRRFFTPRSKKEKWRGCALNNCVAPLGCVFATAREYSSDIHRGGNTFLSLATFQLSGTFEELNSNDIKSKQISDVSPTKPS
jgi:hypothetical protein